MRSRRRIVMVASWYPSRVEPLAGIFVEEQARALARYHDVAVIAPDHRGARKIARFGILPTTEGGGDDFPVVRPLVLGPIPHNWRVLSALYTNAVHRGLAELSRLWGVPDVLHAHVVIPGGYAAARVAQTRGIPFVLSEHWSGFGSHSVKRGSRRLMLTALRSAARVIAVSPALASQLEAAEPSAIVKIIGNAIDTEFYAVVPDTGLPGVRPTRLLSVGYLVPIKGLHDLLEAVHIARLRGVETELAVVGDGPLRSELEVRAATLGLAEHCVFDGFQDRVGVRARLEWCDALVVASYQETFGVTVAEALASGRPVIATRCGGPEFVMGALSGKLVPVGSPSALADAIAELEGGRLEFDAETARASIRERFGFRSFANQLSDVYDAVLA